MVDTDDNCIDSYTWQLVPINEDNCERDLQLERVIEKYKNQTDVKYSRVVTRFKEEYFHRKRNEETQIGAYSAIFFMMRSVRYNAARLGQYQKRAVRPHSPASGFGGDIPV